MSFNNKLGYNVKVVAYIINENALFDSSIQEEILLNLSLAYVGRYKKLCFLLEIFLELKLFANLVYTNEVYLLVSVDRQNIDNEYFFG